VRRDLAAARQRLASLHPQVQFCLAEPLGQHPLLVEVVAERAREAEERMPKRETTKHTKYTKKRKEDQ
jgi:sirohydrochlorin ferrochelatase